MAKRKDIDKIRACAMAIVMISCFKKMARDLRLQNKAQIYICAGPGLHGTGDAVFDSLLCLGGATYDRFRCCYGGYKSWFLRAIFHHC